MAGLDADGRRLPRSLSPPTPLTADLDLAAFDCSQPELNHWLGHRALKNESRFSRTYVVCSENRVVAYVYVSVGSVARVDAPGRVKRNAPEAVPVSVIGRLAVDRALAGQGLGADLLADAPRRITLASKVIGIAAVLVHAKDAAAKAFYRKRCSAATLEAELGIFPRH